MEEDLIACGEAKRKRDEPSAMVKVDAALSEEEEDDELEQEGAGVESEEVNDDNQNQEIDRSLLRNFTQEELTSKLMQRDIRLSLKNSRQPPSHTTTTKTLEDNKFDPNSLRTKDSSPSFSNKQERRQKNFFVAQLVDLNEASQTGRNFHKDHLRNHHFKEDSDQDGSLLAKLMNERNHRNNESQSMDSSRPSNLDISDESCKRQIGSSSQMDDERQHDLHAKQSFDLGAETQRSRSTSAANSFADDQLKVGSIDLDEHLKLVDLFGIQIVALTINGKERLCLAQISNTLLKEFSYNEIHNRRVALGITCVQCTPIQLEMLRRAGAMPSSSRRCGMITMREAERLCKSFLAEEQPPELPENFYFTVAHRVNYGCRGRFVPARYISSRAKCIECFTCGDFFSPNKFIFHSHKDTATTDCNPPDSPNINSWRKHINLDWTHEHSQEIKYAWEDVKSLFNGGTRRRITLGNSLSGTSGDHHQQHHHQADSNLNSPEEGAGQKLMAANSQARSSCRSSALTTQQQQHQQQQQYNQQIQQQTTATDGASLSAIIEETRRAGEQTRGPRVQTLSQNERRKLPIGIWSRDRQKNQDVEHQVRGNTSIKRSPGLPYDNLGQQHYAVKRMAMHHDRQQQHHQQQQQQQQQHKLATSKTSMANQQQAAPMLAEQQQKGSTSLYQHDQSFNLDPMRNQQHLNAASLANLNDFKSEPLNGHVQGDRLAPTDTLVEPNKTSMHMDSSSMSTAGTFLYGQLYSQLMQSQFAHQVNHRSHQQHQMATLEAQVALRQHIWSSLLANLGPQSQFQVEQQSQVGVGQFCKPNQLLDYCLTSPLDQQQNQANSLLAAAAAAAAVSATPSTNISSPSSKSFGRHHQALAAHQGGHMEMDQLKTINVKAPNTTSNPMHLYATVVQANNNDTSAVFNVGGNDNC